MRAATSVRPRRMLLVRRFEARCAELYSATRIRGFLHLYIGQEAIAAGALGVLDPDDAVVATYREHGHALLRGVSARAVMAAMYGKVEGCSRGRGGSMHLFDVRPGSRVAGGHHGSLSSVRASCGQPATTQSSQTP